MSTGCLDLDWKDIVCYYRSFCLYPFSNNPRPAAKYVCQDAVGRADVVGGFFDNITISSKPEASQEIFLHIREAITIAYLFLEMPTRISACYRIIGVVQRNGQQHEKASREGRSPAIAYTQESAFQQFLN
jgi:hypothetical protein